jgi:diguanylate cyclase (GGDEF)-like protein
VAMTRSSRPDEYPRVVRLVLLVLSVAIAARFALSFVPLGSDADGWALVQATIGLLVVVAATVLLVWRVRSRTDERDLWRWLTLAVAALAVGFVGQEVLTVLNATHVAPVARFDSLPLTSCALVACLAIYQGLVRWNRFRTLMAEPADWLNGAGAVLVLAALGNLTVAWTGSPLGQLPWWQLQGLLLRIAAVLVLLGTAATVVSLGGVARDYRAWLICAALAVILGCEILSASTGEPTPFGELSQLGWTLGAAAIAYCAAGRPSELRPKVSTTQSETVGAFVVLVAGAVVLVLNDDFGHHGTRLPVLYASLAFICGGTRAIYVMRALSQFAQSRLEARSDELTGIANRRELFERLGDLVSTHAVIGLLAIDLDRFKEVNDRFGHAAGDNLLRLTAGRLQTRLPRSAHLARLGGDEFAVVLEGAGIAEAVALATALVDALSAPIELDGHIMSVGASIGIAVLPSPLDGTSDDDAGEELLRRADVAMYLAKRAGGGVSVYDVAADTASQELTLRGDELKEVLAAGAPWEGDQLVLHYQPQICLRTGAVVGAEALVRWQHPKLGLLAPAAFLDLVEAHGLMGEMTTRVLGRATAQAMRWHAKGHRLRVAVNLSTSSLTSPELIPLIDRLLATTSFDPHDLTLEITETSFIADSDLALQTAREIAARGIAVSIDDYGTGFSSLSYLNDLPATELKLDRSFIARVVTDDRTAAIVAGTIELAHRLQLRVIAEGVEDQAALEVLRNLDCDEVQGYHCGRPMPLAEFNAWLEVHGQDQIGAAKTLVGALPHRR